MINLQRKKKQEILKKKIAEAAPAERMSNLRIQRNRLLRKKVGYSDYTMTDECSRGKHIDRH